MIAAIAEKKKFSDHIETTLQRSQGQRSPAIVVAAIAWECFIWSLLIAGIAFFLSDRSDHSNGSDHMKSGINFIMAYFQFKSKDCLQRNLYLNCVSLWKALKASDIVWSVSISAVNHIIKEATCDPGIRISRFQGDWSFTRYMWGVQAVWESLNDFQTYLLISS